MPRTLPWKNLAINQNKGATKSDVAVKRKRVEKKDSEDETDEEIRPSRRGNSDDQAASSPPPAPPTEMMMEEGLEKDDRFRMVEDEFLTIAKQFTVHLHTAEYKRQEKMVKFRNAQTISSISRPVTGKMPDHTKRRVKGNEIAKAQRKTLDGLLGKKDVDGRNPDDSDDAGLPYIWTSLHGRMDSPRRKATSLSNIASTGNATRYAAGFSRPTIQSSGKLFGSPEPKKTLKPEPVKRVQQITTFYESTDDEDLDAPIPAPRLFKTESSNEDRPRARRVFPSQQNTTVPRTLLSSSSSFNAPVKLEEKQDNHGLLASPVPNASVAPRVSRFERSRKNKVQEEEKKKKPIDLDIIPSFM